MLGTGSAYRGKETKERTFEIPKTEVDPGGRSHHYKRMVVSAGEARLLSGEP